MLAPVEEARAAQGFEREALAHASHHAPVRAAREVDQTSTSYGRGVNAASREVAEAFELIFAAADFEEARTDLAQLLGVERLEALEPGGLCVGSGARGERRPFAFAPRDAEFARKLAHGAREGDAVHQLVEGYCVAALVAREAVEESLL